MKIKLALALAATFIGLQSTLRPVRAWDHGGHMIVAQIAQKRLHPNVRARVEKLVPLIPDFRAERAGRKPQPYTFVSAACWMDDVRGSQKRESLSSWHYIDVPCGGQVGDVHEQNALDALKLAEVVLRSPQVDEKTKAEWLAVALHVVGDIHQPLHCTDREIGGNTFPLADVPGLEKRIRRDGKAVDRAAPAKGVNAAVYGRLHALWDSAYRYDVVRQKTAQGTRGTIKVLYALGSSAVVPTAKLEEVARDIERVFGPKSEGTSDLKAPAWIRESNRIACDWAFDTPRKRKPSQKYFERAHDTACARLAIAGVRLSAWLNTIFAVAVTSDAGAYRQSRFSSGPSMGRK
ncbi:MAG: hypothetical protein JWN98_2117 [Abditibacteriota bacterium]|nr:hypothetical protein [Abditibacteriota bacterium]